MDGPRGSVELKEAELQRLRRRAYGPDADIAGDAVAQARLSELEAAQRRELTLVVDAPALVAKRVPVAESVEAPRSGTTASPTPTVTVTTTAEPAETSTPPSGDEWADAVILSDVKATSALCLCESTGEGRAPQRVLRTYEARDRRFLLRGPGIFQSMKRP